MFRRQDYATFCHWFVPPDRTPIKVEHQPGAGNTAVFWQRRQFLQHNGLSPLMENDHAIRTNIPAQTFSLVE
jgi:hypothetical protein